MTEPDDIRFMKMALTLAARGLGQVAPNPAVGCVIVDPETGRVLGRGWTQAGGRPHAEAEALARAGALARGATAYVTLEPCSHHGKTPPCADALIEAGIKRVVSAMTDPDERVSGRGHAVLREAGIEVTEDVLRKEAWHLNEGFVRRVLDGRPLVMLKIASSLDGRTATHSGDSQWITGEAARNRGHLMRAETDAIMVGSATAIVDDPVLNCRLPGLSGRSPIRIVADGRLRMQLTSKLVQSAKDIPLWILTLPEGDEDRRAAFEECGAELIDVPKAENGLMDMKIALQEIGARGVTRLMVEGGSRLGSSLMQAGLVDRVDWFQAPKIIGGDGYPAIAALGVGKMDEAPVLARQETIALGEDSLQRFRVEHRE